MFLEGVFSAEDNSGVLYAKYVGIAGNQNKSLKLGDLITIFPEKLNFGKKVTRRKYLGLIIGLRKWTIRSSGVGVRFLGNRILILLENYKFLGTRVYGPICREIRKGKKEVRYRRIISYSYATV
jgi:large subunit ribosomal protein L14